MRARPHRDRLSKLPLPELPLNDLTEFRRARREAGPWLVTPGERLMVWRYRMASKGITSALNTDPLERTHAFEKRLELLDSALTKSPLLAKPLTVYRGERHPRIDLQDGFSNRSQRHDYADSGPDDYVGLTTWANRQWPLGASIRFAGYASFAATPAVAMRFTADELSRPAVLFRTSTLRFSHGALLHVPNVAREYEVILPRKTEAIGVLAGQMAERLAHVLYEGRATPEYDLKATGIVHATYFREGVVDWAHAHPDSGLTVEPLMHASDWARFRFEDRPFTPARRPDRALAPGRRFEGLADDFFDDTAWAPGVERLPNLEMLSPGEDPGLAAIVVVLKREKGRYATARVFSPQGEMGTHFDYTVTAEEIDAQISEWLSDPQATWIEHIRRAVSPSPPQRPPSTRPPRHPSRCPTRTTSSPPSMPPRSPRHPPVPDEDDEEQAQ